VAKISVDGMTGVDDEDHSDDGEGLLVCTFATTGGSITECGFQAMFPTFTPSGEIVASFLDHTSDQYVLSEYAVGATFGGAAPPVLASDATGSLIESAVSPDGTDSRRGRGPEQQFRRRLDRVVQHDDRSVDPPADEWHQR
jgi:hypothetical protein